MSKIHRLYAMTHSLYSGRARSYLIKHQIPFLELSTGHESFKAEVLPKGKLPTIPTLVTPEGEVIRDGAAIIEHFEAANGRPCHPMGAKQQIMSALFDVIGTDGLLRPAMHYRWNFPDENLAFVRYHFLHSQRDTPAREEKTEAMMDRMRHAATVFGVTDESQAVVEALYLELLDALNTHFENHPYLLGAKPCIGDFGLIAPLYAHLGRDPHPARLMQQRATSVFRWVERMNRQDDDYPECFNPVAGFVEEDQVPHSLIEVLRVLSEDFVPETLAAADCINRWLEKNQPEMGTPAIGRLAAAPDMAKFEVRGHSFTAIAQPHRFYLLQRLQDIYRSLSGEERADVDDLLTDCEMTPVVSSVLSRRIVRSENLEVWQ